MNVKNLEKIYQQTVQLKETYLAYHEGMLKSFKGELEKNEKL
jgi:hypothetical protein